MRAPPRAGRVEAFVRFCWRAGPLVFDEHQLQHRDVGLPIQHALLACGTRRSGHQGLEAGVAREVDQHLQHVDHVVECHAIRGEVRVCSEHSSSEPEPKRRRKIREAIRGLIRRGALAVVTPRHRDFRLRPVLHVHLPALKELWARQEAALAQTVLQLLHVHSVSGRRSTRGVLHSDREVCVRFRVRRIRRTGRLHLLPRGGSL